MTVYAVWHFKYGYLVDSCGGGTYHGEEVEAKTWPTAQEAEAEMTGAELGKVGIDYEIVPLVEPWQPIRSPV